MVMERGGMNPGLIAWGGESGELAKLAREWFTASHRRRLLLGIAVWLLQKEEMRPFFAGLRTRWSERIDPEGRPHSLRLLIERMDPANYHPAKGDDGNMYPAFEWPDDLRQKTEQDFDLAGQEIRFLGFPFRCRAILEGTTELAAGDLDVFWEELNQIAVLPPDDGHEEDPMFASRQRDAVCGGIAVLVCRQRAWLLADPSREQWCLAQLRGAVESQIPQSLFDVPDSAGEHWDVFVGEVGVVLLAEDRANATTRWLVAAGVAAHHYAATRQTMRCAFRSRGLGVPFEELHCLALAWAVVRFVLARGERLEIDVERWRTRCLRVVKAFVANRLPNLMGRLGRLNILGRRVVERIHRKRRAARAEHELPPAPRQPGRETPNLDVSTLSAAFAWLDVLDFALSTDRNLLLVADETC